MVHDQQMKHREWWIGQFLRRAELTEISTDSVSEGGLVKFEHEFYGKRGNQLTSRCKVKLAHSAHRAMFFRSLTSDEYAYGVWEYFDDKTKGYDYYSADEGVLGKDVSRDDKQKVFFRRPKSSAEDDMNALLVALKNVYFETCAHS